MMRKAISRLRRLVPSRRVASATARFRTKSLLHHYVPGGWGYMRRLRAARDPGYVHARDMSPVRRRHSAGHGWAPEAAEDGIRHRSYASYDEYVEHQRQKFDEILKMRGGFSPTTVAEWRNKYYRRFKGLVELLPADAAIVCAGARQGTEVEVLRDLGFARAYGIDLNPGPDNPFVRPGDFHRLPQDDGTVDLVYSNSLDHVYDFDRFFADHARALKPEGFVLYDLPQVETDGSPFESVGWDDERVIVERMLAHFSRLVRVVTEPGWKWFLLQGPRR